MEVLVDAAEQETRAERDSFARLCDELRQWKNILADRDADLEKHAEWVAALRKDIVRLQESLGESEEQRRGLQFKNDLLSDRVMELELRNARRALHWDAEREAIALANSHENA
jgi:endonuclease/exonuclease/phosphatase family metal-dependent hydrolase